MDNQKLTTEPQPALEQANVSRCYVVLDLEAAVKDVVWSVCRTLDAAERSKRSLIFATADENRLISIVEMEVE